MISTTQHMALMDAIQVYFHGEKIEALIFILPLGLLSMVFSAWLLTDNPGSFAKGVAIPFLVLGLLMSTVGAVVGFRTPSQTAAIVKVMAADPQSGVEVESQRMMKVNQAWPVYLTIWGLFGVAGLALRFAMTSDFFQGLGIALVFFAGVGLLIDGFAERRTHPYVEALKALNLAAETLR